MLYHHVQSLLQIRLGYPANGLVNTVGTGDTSQHILNGTAIRVFIGHKGLGALALCHLNDLVPPCISQVAFSS